MNGVLDKPPYRLTASNFPLFALLDLMNRFACRNAIARIYSPVEASSAVATDLNNDFSLTDNIIVNRSRAMLERFTTDIKRREPMGVGCLYVV